MVASVLGGGSAGAVTGATPVPDGTYSFNAKITFGQVHACSGALIERSWVVTAKSCFAEGNAPVVAGPPTQPTTVVVGRADLTEATGYEVSAVSVIPHPDRNLALVQLPVPVSEEVPAIPIATSPAALETLKISGYGRTATEWVPNQLHAASFTVQDVEPSLIDVVGAAEGATICKGDAGGPVFRENDGNAQLVAINNTSWQKGCLGENTTQDGATGTRIDDLTDWILWNTCNAPGWTSTDNPQPVESNQQVGNNRVVQDLALSDYDGDGRSDLALYHSNPADGSAWWIRSGATGEQIRGGYRYGGCTDIPAPGDYDGDGTTDLALYRRDCTNGSTWWIQSGATGEQIRGGYRYGGCTDIPAPGDYDGDGATDLALYRRDCTSGSTWSIYSNRRDVHLKAGFKYGGCTDIPAPGDYDGDGATDLALYRRDCTNGSTWSIYSNRRDVHLKAGFKYGGCRDIPAPGDYNGDDATDLILYRRDCTNGSTWSIYSSHTNTELRSGLRYGGCAAIPAASNPATTNTRPHGPVYDRARAADGTWASGATRVDADTAISGIAAASLPDGGMHLFTVVPGSGLWHREAGQSEATRVDGNGGLSAVAAAGLPDGTLHVFVLAPGSGVWERVRAVDGTWAPNATQIDANPNITALAAVALPDGTLHLQVAVPDSGAWDRKRDTDGNWASNATRFDTNDAITAIASAALPDGGLHIFTAVPGSGVWHHAGSNSSAALVDTSPAILAVSAAGLHNGTLQLDVAVDGSGVWHRSRDTSGTWQSDPTQVDPNRRIFSTYTVGLPDNSIHLGTNATIS